MRIISSFPLIDGPLVYRQPQAAQGAKCFLLEGEIMTAPERKRALVEAMARALLRHDVGSEQDAVRLLHHLGFGSLNVALLAGAAFDLKRQFDETQGMVAHQMMDKPT